MILLLPGGHVGHLLDPCDGARARCGLVLPSCYTEATRGVQLCQRCEARRRGQAAWAVRWEASVLASFRRAARRLVVAESDRQRRYVNRARFDLAENSADCGAP